MKKQRIIIGLLFTVVLVIGIGWGIGKQTETVTYHYRSDDVAFSVTYPKEWQVVSFKGSPSWGITLYIDEAHAESITIEKTIAPYNLDEGGYTITQLVTDEGKQAKVLTTSYKGRVESHVFINEPQTGEYYHVAITVDETVYQKNENQIQKVVKSLAYE